MNSATVTLLLFTLCSYIYASPSLVKNAIEVADAAEGAVAFDLFFTTASADMYRPVVEEVKIKERDGSQSYTIFCNRAYDIRNRRCGGACTARYIQPNTCTAAPGTNCVELNRNVAADYDVRNRGGCNGGAVTRLSNLPRIGCVSIGGCYNTPGTQSFYYY